VTSHDDLKEVTNQSNWFVTIAIPAPSNLDDAQARFELEWRNARRQLSEGWDADDLDRLDELVGGLRHSDGTSLVVIHARHGSTLIELLDEPTRRRPLMRGRCPGGRR
jgi:hypothetical protein